MKTSFFSFFLWAGVWEQQGRGIPPKSLGSLRFQLSCQAGLRSSENVLLEDWLVEVVHSSAKAVCALHSWVISPSFLLPFLCRCDWLNHCWLTHNPFSPKDDWQQICIMELPKQGPQPLIIWLTYKSLSLGWGISGILETCVLGMGANTNIGKGSPIAKELTRVFCQELRS